MSSKSDILKQAQALMQARLVEQSDLILPCIGLFRARFCEEYICTAEQRRVLMPPEIALQFVPAEYLLESEHYTQLDYQAPVTYIAEEFIEALSLLHNLDEEEVATVLTAEVKEFLDGLFRGRRVAFFGLGDFFVTEEIAGVLLLNFVPSPALLDLLNQPFSIYQPTPLREGVQFPELQNTTTRADRSQVQQFAITEPALESPITAASPVPTMPEEAIEEPAPVEAVNDIPAPTKKHKPLPLLWISLAVIGLLLFGLWLLLPQPMAPRYRGAEEIALSKDTLPEIKDTDTFALEPSTPPQPLDTLQVSRGGSLAQLARHYYGNVYYWVYIYMANKDSIPDPNNLRYGQTLVVPSLEIFDLKKDSLEALQEAKVWESIIQNRKFYSYTEQRATISLP